MTFDSRVSASIADAISVDDAIFVDEVGIETGLFATFRLKSAYQPIFSREGGFLVAQAVDGLIVPFRKGKRVDATAFFKRITPEECPFVERMNCALSLRNHHNIGLEGLDLHFRCPSRADAPALRREIEFVTGRIADIRIDPKQLVCEITRTISLDVERLVALCDSLRGLGVRIAIGQFDASPPVEQLVQLVRPDIVRIGAGWFHELCREAATVLLFGSIVAAYRDGATKILIEGIEGKRHLRVALDAGADLLQGNFLAPAALAGTVFHEEPLSTARLLGGTDNVVPLFG